MRVNKPNARCTYPDCGEHGFFFTTKKGEDLPQLRCGNGHWFGHHGEEKYRAPTRVRDNEPDYVPPERRMRHSMRQGSAEKHEENHRQLIKMDREILRDKGRGKAEKDGMQRTHRILPELYHAKMETDKDYWKDPNNLAKHTNSAIDT